MKISKGLQPNPKICHYQYNLEKVWYVHFRMTHPITGYRKQFRFYGNLHSIKTKGKRLESAKDLLTAVKEKLREGWSPFPEDNAGSYSTIHEALLSVTKLQWKSLRERTLHTYNVVISVFYRWLETSGFGKVEPEQFEYPLAQMYMDYLSQKGLSGRTYNNHLAFMKIFFNYLVGREIIVKNPFKNIRKQGEERSVRNFAFSHEEEQLIRKYMQIHEPNLYIFTQFIYYTFVRPKELSMLKVSDIDFANGTINIRSEVSKNKKSESVVIPDSFLPLVKSMNLNQIPSDWYLFSFGCRPGPEFNRSFDKLTPKHKKILRSLRINENCTLYSWKHTGVLRAYYLLNFDLYAIMKQCRHYDISMTQNYLKSLGFIENSSFRSKMR